MDLKVQTPGNCGGAGFAAHTAAAGCSRVAELSPDAMHLPRISASAHSVCSVPLGMLLQNRRWVIWTHVHLPHPRARPLGNSTLLPAPRGMCLLPRAGGPLPAAAQLFPLPLWPVQHQALSTSWRPWQRSPTPLQTSRPRGAGSLQWPFLSQTLP